MSHISHIYPTYEVTTNTLHNEFTIKTHSDIIEIMSEKEKLTLTVTDFVEFKNTFTKITAEINKLNEKESIVNKSTLNVYTSLTGNDNFFEIVIKKDSIDFCYVDDDKRIENASFHALDFRELSQHLLPSICDFVSLNNDSFDVAKDKR